MYLHPRQRRPGNQACGFTLTEILLVVAIIVMIGGIGGGVYVGTYKRLLAQKAARQFLLMARYARIAAIEHQKPYELQLDPEKGFLLATTQQNESTGQTERVQIANYYCRPVAFEGDVKLEDVRFDGSAAELGTDTDQGISIPFLPNGSSRAAVVQIGDGKRHYTVAVAASTGRATLYAGRAYAVRNGTIDLDAQ